MALWTWPRGNEDHYPPLTQFPLAVTAAGALRNRVQASQGAIDDREVDIHTSLDQLRADDANLGSGLELHFDVG